MTTLRDAKAAAALRDPVRSSGGLHKKSRLGRGLPSYSAFRS